jgi:uncharacterized membrane protein YfcA
MTPLLVLVFGIHPASAVGTDLLYAAATKTGGTLVHGLNKTVNWRITGWLACGSIPTTAVTIFILSYFAGKTNAIGGVISTVLGFALILTAIALLFRKWILDFFARRFGEPKPARTRWLTIALGMWLGVLVSLSSVGAGAIGVTVLLILYPRLPVAQIVGSDIAHAVPLTLIAGLGHWYLGDVNFVLLVSLLVGSLPGIALGSHIAARVPDKVLRHPRQHARRGGRPARGLRR